MYHLLTLRPCGWHNNIYFLSYRLISVIDTKNIKNFLRTLDLNDLSYNDLKL